MKMLSESSGFAEGAGVAFALSLMATLIYRGSTVFLRSGVSVATLFVFLLSLYALYLLKRSNRSAGKPTAVIAFIGLALLVNSLSLPFAMVAGVLLPAVWVLRCFFYRQGVIDSALDLGLSAAALIAAIVAATATQSIFISVWTFFIVQALHVSIPLLGEAPGRPTNPTQQFDCAYTSAETAIRQFYSER